MKTNKSGTRTILFVASIIISLIVVIGISCNAYFTKYATRRLHELSNHESGATLSEFIESIQQNSPKYEIIAVFDEKGNKLIEYTEFSELSVGLPSEAKSLLQSFDNLTHVHNHPEGDSGHSDNDLSMPDRTGLSEPIISLVVISDSCVYRMDRGDKPWPTASEVAEYFMQLAQKHAPLRDSGYTHVVVHNGTEYEVFTDKCLSEFAEKFGHSLTITDASGNKAPLK